MTSFSYLRGLLLYLTTFISPWVVAGAWSTPVATPSFAAHRPRSSSAATSGARYSTTGPQEDEGASDASSSSSSSSSSDDAALDDVLTTALARLDQQWKMQQKNQGAASRWSKILLPPNAPADTASAGPQQAGASTELPPPLVNLPPPPPPPPPLELSQDFVYLLEPPRGTRPSCLVVFWGGAGLGAYPQIAYHELLTRISDRLNAAILAAPYNVGLDHFTMSKETGEKIRRALLQVQDDPTRQYPATLPVYCLAHSLGCKLATIYLAATTMPTFQGIGFMSFNNFSFGKTVAMARQFADQIRQGIQGPSQGFGQSDSVTSNLLNQVFQFAEMAITAVGLDFTPTSAQMERLIQLKFDANYQQKTRLFTFDDDQLENTPDFVRACVGKGPEVSALPGTHLTPVFFKLGLDQLPAEAREMAREATGGIESASFGNELELQALVDEICSWMLTGTGPSRKPAWQRERPPIAAAASSPPGEKTAD